MSFFFGGGGTKVKPQYTGIQLQTASSTLALTIAWGCNRFAPNLFWYDDFKAIKHKQKAGKGGGSVESYTYSASCAMALCEGTISGIGRYWKDQSVSDFSSGGFSLFTGTMPQAPWGYWTSKHPSVARGYPGVAYIAIANYDLGGSAALPNHSFEVKSRAFSTSKDGSNDADPAIIFDEFLTHPAFGVGMPSENIGYDTLNSTAHATTTGDSTFQTYCAAMGFGLSPVLSDPTAASDIFDKWLKMTNTAVVWTGYKLNFIPYDLSDVDGNGYKYRPVTATIYTLTDDDFLSDKDDPVKVTRKDPADANNALKLTFSNAANEYNDAPVEYKDQGLIDTFGLRQGSTFEAKEITRIEMATKVVAMLGQRDAYVRNTYSFELGPEYCLIEPMDLLELIDAKIGTVVVQVSHVEEEDGGNFKIDAEEVKVEVSSSGGFSPPVITPGGQNQAASPGSVNTPIIFDAPPDMSNGIPQVWAAVSGGNGTTANPYWGGCNVYVSRDGATYQAIGVVDTPARMGKTTSILSSFSGSNPQAATVGVDLSMSGGELMSVTPSEAAANATLSILGGEFISFEDADLTATNKYDLSTLYRGLYRTAAGAHASGVPFARLDEAIFKYQLPEDYVGVPLTFKFQSFNIWGKEIQPLEDCVEYDYTPSGLGFQIAAPSSTSLAFTARTQSDGTNIIEATVTVGASAGPYLDHYDVQIATGPGYTNWVDLPSINSSSTKTTLQPALASTDYKARARAVSSAVGGQPSSWVESAVVNSGSLGGTAPAAPTSLVASGLTLANKLTWDAGSGGGTPSGFKIYAIHGATGNFVDATLIGQVSGITSFTHTGLDADDTWRYWVTAYNPAGASSPAGPSNATTNEGGGGGSLEVEREGLTIVAAATVLNFTGDGVSVTESPEGTAVINIDGGGSGGSSRAVPTVVQMATLRNDGTLALPSAPTPGNLLVFVSGGYWGGYAGSLYNYQPGTFSRVGWTTSDSNNGTMCSQHIYQEGEPYSWSLSASDNQFCAVYEFQDAASAIMHMGTYAQTPSTAPIGMVDVGHPIFDNAVRLVVLENDNDSTFAVGSAAGLTVDFLVNDGGNHRGAIVRLDPEEFIDGRVTFTCSYQTAVFGVYYVVGKKE